MKKHFVFKLGPVDRDAGTFCMYYVFPGLDDAWAFPAASDEQGLMLITEHHDPAHLVCERGLAGTAKTHGIETDDFDQGRSHELALMAYEHLPGPPMRHVLQEGLIWQFAYSAKEYDQARPWDKEFSKQPIRIEFRGNLNLATYAFIHPDDDNSPFTVLFEVEDADPNSLSVDYSAIKERGHIGVEFCDGPAFARDAMQRAHGLDTIPVPYVVRDGRRDIVDDLQIGILIVALTAVAHLKEDATGASGQLQLGNIDLRASVAATE